MKKFITILLLLFASFTYAQITTIKVQGSGGSGSVGTLQQVFNTESGGSVLTKLDTINWSTTGIRILGAGALTLNTGGITALANTISATNSSATAIAGNSTSASGVQGSSTNLFGVNAISTNSYALHAQTSSTTTTTATANFERSTAVTNTVLPLLQIARYTSGTAANGIGTSLEFQTEASDGTAYNSTVLEGVLTNATAATRTSQFNIKGLNSAATETFANFQTGSIVIVGNGADTLATKAYARSVGGSGGGNTIYTGDDALTSDRTVDLDGKILSLSQSGSGILIIDPLGFETRLNAGDGTAISQLTTRGDAANDVDFRIATYNGTNTVDIVGDANANTLIHTADSIAFNSTLSGTSNGYVWTLANSALGTGYWAAASVGTVTSVSGTANRITSTGGATPVIDISGSYVGQSSITTLGTIGTGTWQGSVIGSTYGGTGVNNGASTITLGGNFVTSGANSLTLTTTGATNVTLPTTGTLATTAGLAAYLPLAGGTMVGNIIATDNTYDLGASGATRFRTAYLGTSAVIPLVSGSVSSGANLTLQSTTHATKGFLLFGTSGYDEVNNRLGIGNISPASDLDVRKTVAGGNLTIMANNLSSTGFSRIIAQNDASVQGYFGVRGSAAGAYGAIPQSTPFMYTAGLSLTFMADNASGILKFASGGNTERWRISETGTLSNTAGTGTAYIHIKAGTATASTGQIKLAVGTGPTTPEDGLINYTSAKGLTFDVSTSVRSTVGLWAYKAITATYPITATDYTLEATSGTFTTTLPTAVGIDGRVYILTNSGAGVVTVATTSSQTFVNVLTTPTTLTLSQFNTVTVQSNGANWLRLTNL